MNANFTFQLNRIPATVLFVLALTTVSESLQAQCNNAPTLKFHSPVLIDGTDGQAGAVYNFADVMPGLDAHIEIVDLVGGATLNNIDDSTGIGYYDAFQPYVGAGANDTSYIDWKITFKKGGTLIDTTLACLAVTGVDVDGDASSLKEFIEAATPGSFAVDPLTNLGVSFDGVRSKAISPVANIPNIDTNRLEAMFQMNFVNITSLEYRNGAITTGGAQVRQTCIYFKPFFQNYFLLPTNLLSFTGSAKDQTVQLKWSATDESNMKHYTVQRSENGRNWTNIANIPVQTKSTIGNYELNDFTELKTETYYRLMELSVNGTTKYSSIIKISPKNSTQESFNHNTVFSNNIRIQCTVAKTEELNMTIYSLNGSQVATQKSIMRAGSNTVVMNVPSSITPGVYLLLVENNSGQKVYQSKLIKTN